MILVAMTLVSVYVPLQISRNWLLYALIVHRDFVL